MLPHILQNFINNMGRSTFSLLYGRWRYKAFLKEYRISQTKQ